MTPSSVEREQPRGGQFEIVGYGIDDVTVGFDMTGSRSLTRGAHAEGHA